MKPEEALEAVAAIALLAAWSLVTVARPLVRRAVRALLGPGAR